MRQRVAHARRSTLKTEFMETVPYRHLPFSADMILARPKRESDTAGRYLTETDVFDQVKATPLIFCRNCNYPVTRPSERIEVDAAHRHTFANPNGYLFEIGCFRSADGCGTTGMKSTEFAWFRGYTWQIGICRKCHIHLGWRFQSGADQFYGLILTRLTE